MMGVVSDRREDNGPVQKAARPARMGKLAVLPVFYPLDGRKVLVAGGMEAAAWKTELLLATGAIVHLYAPELSPGMSALFEDENGRLIHAGHDWREADFSGFHMAIGDIEDDEAEEFASAARAAGVPVNVIDKPAFCQFQFGSIVNRSPVVVSISTDGAAPILGQAIRRRIETLLPRSLAAWAGLAEKLRKTVTDRLEPGVERRNFWEGFVDKVFASSVAPVATDEEQLLETIGSTTARAGSVTLVGAGPGDAELLTLKAMRALQSADIILFDDLVSVDVLELARREAKRMLVGKRGGRTSCKQEDINALMLKFARSGKRVVRLKSGDPSVFGRSGEELECLRAAGIEVSVIPGITAASAMAASLGTSLTHRDVSQSVRFVTGHSRDGRLPETVDWKSIATEATTSIFYMGGRTAAQIAGKLIEQGMAASMPVVIVSNVSRSSERRWSGVLSTLEDGMAAIGYDEPVLIGIGSVFEKAGIEAVQIPHEIPERQAS